MTPVRLEPESPRSRLKHFTTEPQSLPIARRLRAKFWPECAIPDTSMKFSTGVDHD